MLQGGPVGGREWDKITRSCASPPLFGLPGAPYVITARAWANSGPGRLPRPGSGIVFLVPLDSRAPRGSIPPRNTIPCSPVQF